MDLRGGRVEAGGEIGVARLDQVVDFDQVGRGLRRLHRFGDDGDHRIADMADAVGDEHGVRRRRHRRAVASC